MAATRSRLLTISDRAYRLLLAAYPAQFRQRFGQEMAQVFRTCCSASYDSSGMRGVMGLWLFTLWDWSQSAVGEWLSRSFRRSPVYNVHPRRSISQLIPMLCFLSACLVLLLANPCSWLGPESPFGFEACWVNVNNQSGKDLRVTPINAEQPVSAIRLYRTAFPIFPAYQQSHIAIKSGEQVSLLYDCTNQGVSNLYACDLDGECYLHQKSYYVYPMSVGFTFVSLGNLSHPDAALEAVVQSFPEYDYSGIKEMVLCFVVIIALIGGGYGLVRAKTIAIPKGEV